MNITLSQELQKRIAEKVERGDVGTARLTCGASAHFLSRLRRRRDGEDEFQGTKAAIDEAVEQGERGEGRPAEEVFADLRAKYGISR